MKDIKRSAAWIMLSNHIHVWLGQGKLKYWQFILDRVLAHYQLDTKPLPNDGEKQVILMVDGLPGGQGGLTDRLRGALSVFSLCQECGWRFRIHFVFPFDLREYLQPAAYNWSIETDEIVRTTPYSRPIALYFMRVLGENMLDRYLLRREINKGDHAQYHIYTSAFFGSKLYPGLFRQLFRPTPIVQKAIDKNLAALGEKYIAVSFRFQELLGDLKEAAECVTLPEEEQKTLIEKCLHRLQQLINQQPVSHKILVTADSGKFLKAASALPRVYIAPGKVFHPQYTAEGEHPFIKSFVDLYTLIGAKKVYLLQTGQMYRSGFPEFAALLGGHEFNVIRF